MISSFGDESSDETKSRVFAVAAIVGSKEDWEAFRSKWAERMGGKVFHASDCESGRKDFFGMEKPEIDSLLEDLTKILADSKLMGYGYAIDLAAYRSVASSVLKEFPDMPYYHCFLRTVVYITDLASTFIPRDRVEFTFDQHKVTQYNAGLLYEWITQFRDDMVEKISFATRREPGVQAADLWVREVMKRADSHLRREPAYVRPYLKTLLGTNRFKAKLSSAEEMAETYDQITTDTGELEEEFHSWISANRLIDNLSNRFRFMAMRSWNHDEQ
jgi:hypothetical protein